jgi:predicted flap endonuclease-1-like 5' DNA nuclease
MAYLLIQMFLYMLVAFLLGLLLGWLIWRYGKTYATCDCDALHAENAALQARIDRMATPAPVATTFTGEASKPEGLTAPRGGASDPLQEINGIGPKLEKLLHSLGYFHFDQIAEWTTSDLAWVDDNLEGFKGRATRDEWVPQAQVLARR